MNQEFMKQKKVLPLVLSMSLPMMVSMLINSLYNIVDSMFVAQIGEAALTAVSLVYPLQMLVTSIGVGFGVGISAAAAFYLGGRTKGSGKGGVPGLLFKHCARRVPVGGLNGVAARVFKAFYKGRADL